MKKTSSKEEFKVKEQVPPGTGLPDEVTVMDKLNDLGVTKDQLYDEGSEEDEEQDKPKCVVVNPGDDKAKLMIQELKERGLNPVTEIKEKMSLNFDEVTRFINEERNIGNDYIAIFLPLSNDDLNKENGKLWNALLELNRTVSIPVRAWFADHEDVEIERRLSRLKQ